MKLGLSWVNHLKGAALAASSQAGALAAGNLVVDHLSAKWRSGPGIAAELRFDLGVPKPVRVIGLFGTNLTATAQWTIRLSSSDAHVGDLHDSGALANAGFVVVNTVLGRDFSQALLVLPAAITARYVAIDLADASVSAQNYIEAGAAWAGDLWQPTWTRSWGAMDGLTGEAQPNFAEGGAKYQVKRERRRLSQFSLDHLTDAERLDQVAKIDRLAGTVENVLLVTDPARPQQNQTAIFGTLTTLAPVTRRQVNIGSRRYEVEERL